MGLINVWRAGGAALSLILLGIFLASPVSRASAGEHSDRPEFTPRFLSLAAAKINVRTGPGKRYPIKWVFQRRSLPVIAIDQFRDWYQILDSEGDSGWIHRRLLSSSRTAIVAGETRAFFQRPGTEAEIVFRAEAGVIARLIACGGPWCEVEIGERRAFIPRTDLWGVSESENVE
jgi:SH3-like domain-containing protein